MYFIRGKKYCEVEKVFFYLIFVMLGCFRVSYGPHIKIVNAIFKSLFPIQEYKRYELLKILFFSEEESSRFLNLSKWPSHKYDTSNRNLAIF